jgi:hypothetical protein
MTLVSGAEYTVKGKKPRVYIHSFFIFHIWIECRTRALQDGGQRNPPTDSYISVMFEGTEM